jgi:hypothetical protein
VRRGVSALALDVVGLLVEQVGVHVHGDLLRWLIQPSGRRVTADRPELGAVGEPAEPSAEPFRE